MQLLWQDETKFATLFTKKEQNQSGSVPKAAVDRNRTDTGITTHGILSPGRPSGYEPDELPDCSTPRYLNYYKYLRFICQ